MEDITQKFVHSIDIFVGIILTKNNATNLLIPILERLMTTQNNEEEYFYLNISSR